VSYGHATWPTDRSTLLHAVRLRVDADLRVPCECGGGQTGRVVESAAERRSGAWPRVRGGAAFVFGAGFVVAFTAALIRTQMVFIEVAPRDAWPVIAIGIAFVAVGTLMFLEPGQRVNGALLVFFGVGYSINWVSPVDRSAPAAVLIQVSGALPWLCLAWFLLRYPDRSLARWYERAFLAVAAVWLIGWQSLATITWPPRWADGVQVAGWPWWLPSYRLYEVSQRALELGMVALDVGFVVLMVLRVLRTRGLDRATYRPTYVAAGALTIAWFASGISTVGRADIGNVQRPAYLVLEWLGLLIIPLVLLYGLMRHRLARSRVADLVIRVNAAASPAEVQAALRRTMADPGLMVLFWSADLAGYVDARGRPLSDQPTDGRLALPVTNRGGEPLAVVHADASVAHHRDLLDAALAAGSLALENAALHASLLARLAEVRESTERERTSRELSETLSRLLPTGLADRFRGGGLRIGQPEMVEVTVLMSDIRGYSGIAEATDPGQLVAQLNEHRRVTNRVIVNHAGIVMQYVGDAVVAVFGPTTPPGRHADQALAAAQEIHLAQRQINETWSSQGLPIFGLGIGLSTGPVAAVLLGSEERLEYTLIGDTVNLAQRLQDLARPSGSTVMSQATWDNLTDPPDEYERLTPQLVKGRRGPVTCYRVTMPEHDLPVSPKTTSTSDI
jgi:class 3 adenylate cyclase